MTSPSFRRWFRRSKVVTTAGEPLVVYHGTPNSFSAFVPKTYTDRSGFYFTSDPSFASVFAENAADGIAYEPSEEAQGASVMPVYLSLQNPLDVTEGWPEKIAEELAIIVDPEWLTSWPPSDFWNALDGSEGESIASRLQFLGYDGIVASEVGYKVYVAFRPEQIKSAIGNSGAFDPANPDICDSRLRPDVKHVHDRRQEQSAIDEELVP